MTGSLIINEDQRRKLTSFPEGKLLEIKEDCIVGGHYHKIKTEYFVLVEGYAKIKLGTVTKVMRKGKLIIVPPFTFHEFEIKEDSILMGLCTHEFDPHDDYKL